MKKEDVIKLINNSDLDEHSLKYLYNQVEYLVKQQNKRKSKNSKLPKKIESKTDSVLSEFDGGVYS